MTDEPLLAGVELGGTKVFVLRARGRNILDRVALPTTGPDETLAAAAALLADWQRDQRFAALGIASFGPIRVDPAAPDFGLMLPTPKPGWTGADVAGALSRDMDCPVALDTDVNGAALAEWRWGAGAAGTSDCLCYITIGTGLGGGFVMHGQPLHGAMHPELGHILVRRAPGDTFAGACPFHRDCIEGLIAGPSLAARFGMAGDLIPNEDPRWDDVAHDLAQLIGTILLTTAARQVLIGGGIGMGRPQLLPKVHALLVDQLAGYLSFVTPQTVAQIVRPPALGDQAGPLGAVALALRALEQA
ncbi:MAG: ROK family protein [Sphingobium sp.]|uniref:ROK family protein n=1 Tax=Sphingobium sp. TaxID=1912891 RepID=UPI002E1DCE43